MKKIPVGVLGATGLIGQTFVTLLKNHPWFELTFLGGSKELSYEEAVEGRWHLPSKIPSGLHVERLDAIESAKKKCRLIFSALPSDLAKLYEEEYAKAGLPVLSNSSQHRESPLVPLLIAEINSDHLQLIEQQRKAKGWKEGFLVTKPNCAIQSFMLPLTPLHHAFGIKELHITTLQAISGAGITGLASMSIQDNVIPYIADEEEKVETEPRKIFGKMENGQLNLATEISISAHCNRVPVLNGHTACVSVSFHQKPTREAILSAWEAFAPLNLPSAPKPVTYRNEPTRPQPRLDLASEEGMGVIVGRLRECPLLDYRFVGLSHNAVRGGAGGAILNAELLVQKGYIS